MASHTPYRHGTDPDSGNAHLILRRWCACMVSQGLGFGAKFSLFVGCLGAGAIGYAATIGMTPVELYERSIEYLDLGEAGVPEAVVQIEQPTMVTPDKHVHPYAAKPYWWKVWFAIRRIFFLLSIVMPFFIEGIKVKVFPENEENKEQRRARFCSMVVQALNQGGAMPFFARVPALWVAWHLLALWVARHGTSLVYGWQDMAPPCFMGGKTWHLLALWVARLGGAARSIKVVLHGSKEVRDASCMCDPASPVQHDQDRSPYSRNRILRRYLIMLLTLF